MSTSDAPPPAPPPDGKDWTWVLERPCAECGFEPAAVAPSAVGDLLRDNTASWIELLGGDDAGLRARPEPAVWSTLEYACHVRDVHRLYLERLELMLTEDGPHYPDWDQDETAVESRYDLADPSIVAVELRLAGSALADRFDTVAGDQWSRPGYRSDGAEFNVATFAKYFIHDPIHHLWDVGVR